MRSLIQVSAGIAVACGLLSYAQAAPPAAAAVCAACHTSNGTNGMGPSFKGVYGRKSGTAARFNYSEAMRKAGVTWDDKTLDSFIADPQKAIPGNVMPFPGISDARQRVEIIDYLKSVK